MKLSLYALRGLLPRTRGALILAYHSIDAHDDQYTVSPEMFEWQMEEIARQGIRVISLRELEEMLNAGRVDDKTALLTFDDGRRDNYTNLFPIVRKRKIPVTIFSITGEIGKVHASSVRLMSMLTEAEMREMQASGLVDFEPHTETHPKLTTVSLEDVRREVDSSKYTLEKMFSKVCSYFAYPYGRHTPEIRRVVKESGIRLALATHAGFVTTESDRMALPRNDIRHDVTRAQFKSILNCSSLR
ncbi:MAG: polysaccharide deacetylase family protein [Patescibacteria group bacterium]